VPTRLDEGRVYRFPGCIYLTYRFGVRLREWGTRRVVRVSRWCTCGKRALRRDACPPAAATNLIRLGGSTYCGPRPLEVSPVDSVRVDVQAGPEVTG
jgi:hypothetical protein